MTTPILDHLRAATRDLHDGLEARLDVFARVADPARRREMVGRFLTFYRPAEAALARVLGEEPDLEFAARRKTPALERDVAALKASPPADAPLAPPSGRCEALGFLYVLEGSTLGGRVIDKQLRLRGLSAEGLSFFKAMARRPARVGRRSAPCSNGPTTRPPRRGAPARPSPRWKPGCAEFRHERLGPHPEQIASCDREPIHIPGAIQPHGVLLVLDRDTLEIQHAAGDVAGLLGADAWIGASAGAVLGDALARRIAAVTASGGGGFVGALRVGDQAFDVSATFQADKVLVEIEPGLDQALTGSCILAQLEAAAAAFERCPGLKTLYDRAATEFRRLTGYDRVMIYRFGEDDAGEVVAESRAPPGPGLPQPSLPGQRTSPSRPGPCTCATWCGPSPTPPTSPRRCCRRRKPNWT